MRFSLRNKANIYIMVVWILLYAATPLYMYYALLSIGEVFQWTELWDTCCYITAFLILFLIHHYILLPLLMRKKQKWIYLIGITSSIALFTTYIKCNEQNFVPKRENMQMEREQRNLEPPFMHHGKEHLRHDGRPPMNHEEGRPMDNKEGRPMDIMERHSKDHKERHNHKRLPLTPPDMARLIIAILMIGADFGAAAWINEEKMRKKLLLLEQQTLRQELEHLRYQINPHFFMNTLNNIHVLVDIDQERAKQAIIELSKLMRYALYEGNDSTTPLSHEIEFIQMYISLMKLRYNDKVTVNCELTENIPTEIRIAPLMLVTFIENAFKHGVSYIKPSYINIRLKIEESKIHFFCSNSRHAHTQPTEDGHHGIGLENVRKRLDLQYANNYTLDINDSEEEVFSVELILPSTT